MVLTVNENGFTIEGKTRAEYDAEIREQAITEFKEAVVAELHEILEEFYQMKPHDQENPYNEGMQKGYKYALEIVRKGGKHLKGCVNCKHQSEQRTACEWYKSQGLFLRECPEWVRKE